VNSDKHLDKNMMTKADTANHN